MFRGLSTWRRESYLPAISRTLKLRAEQRSSSRMSRSSTENVAEPPGFGGSDVSYRSNLGRGGGLYREKMGVYRGTYLRDVLQI